MRWFVYRLWAMSPGELLWRLRQAIKAGYWKRTSNWNAPTPEFSKLREDWTVPADLGGTLESKPLLDEATAYLEGDYHMLGVKFHESPIDWHRDPQSGKRAPCDFSLDVNYRNPGLVGNIKNIWEKSRHHHLTVLALSFAMTQEEKYASAVEITLQSWVESNPVMRGVNWSSSLELGVRLISWVWIERLLRGSRQHVRLFGAGGTLWPAIYWHQHLIAESYSVGSSANNHLVGEMAGLHVAATAWPAFNDSEIWRTLSRNMLESEISRQTFPSGFNREQAFAYHVFALELFLFAFLESHRSGLPFSDQYTRSLRRMMEVIPQVTDVSGNLPRYGDSDEGMAVQLRPIASSRTAWLYRIGKAVFHADVPQPENGEGFLQAALLFPERISPGYKSTVSRPARNSAAFPDSGLYLLASHRGTTDEVFCLVDAGPLGFTSIAAHGHADALAFTLSIGGTPFFIDPGTYCYHSEAEWRNYFRSTRAHNTVEIDGMDQSVQAGPFMWTKKARCSIHQWIDRAGKVELVASHDGYGRLGVAHRRRVSLGHRLLEIEDYLSGTGRHTVRAYFHLHPDCGLEQLGEGTFNVNHGDRSIMLTCTGAQRCLLIRGKQLGGWYSPSFGKMVETNTIIAESVTDLPHQFKYSIAVRQRGSNSQRRDL